MVQIPSDTMLHTRQLNMAEKHEEERQINIALCQQNPGNYSKTRLNQHFKLCAGNNHPTCA